MTEKRNAPRKLSESLPRVLKIGAAVVLFIVMLATMGAVVVKDSRKNPAYCATCHEDPHYESWANADSIHLAHSHAERGISCQTCHDRTLMESLDEWRAYVVGYEVPLAERKWTTDQCLVCHGTYARMIPLTTTEILGSERNPHDGHWGELECGTCHNMHRNSVDYCSGCHNPVTDSPGWVRPTAGG